MSSIKKLFLKTESVPTKVFHSGVFYSSLTALIILQAFLNGNHLYVSLGWLMFLVAVIADQLILSSYKAKKQQNEKPSVTINIEKAMIDNQQEFLKDLNAHIKDSFK